MVMFSHTEVGILTQTPQPAAVRCDAIRFVKELYPRLKPLDDVVERYRDALANLPPIIVARDGVLVDGYHRWQAHVREGAETIQGENLGDLTDSEIIRESIRRNAAHGQQLTRQDKKRLAAQLWFSLAALSAPERTQEIVDLLAVSRDAVERWTKDARAIEKKAQQDKAWDLHLDCLTQREIADAVRVAVMTINDWIGVRKSAFAENRTPPTPASTSTCGSSQRSIKTQGSNRTSGPCRRRSSKTYCGFLPSLGMSWLISLLARGPP